MKSFEELTIDEQLQLIAYEELCKRNAKPHRNRLQCKVRETSNGIITIIKKREYNTNRNAEHICI